MAKLVPPADSEDAPSPLSGIPIFALLPPAEQRELYALMSVAEFPAGKTVCWFGDPGDSFYLIQRGQLVVTVPNERGEHVVLNYLGPGGFFGEISLLDGGTRTASVRALEPAELYVLGRDDFHAFLRRYPEAAIEILAVMGSRQRAQTEAFRGLQNPNLAFEVQRASRWQRLSDRAATLAASAPFLLGHVLVFAVWVAWNALAVAGVIPSAWAFDDPTYGILTMAVSLEAILLTIFVLVSQNRQAEKDRIDTDLDYQVNVKAQTEILGIVQRLARIEEHLGRVASEPPAVPPPPESPRASG
jgi:uncharacterized membrane protein